MNLFCNHVSYQSCETVKVTLQGSLMAIVVPFKCTTTVKFPFTQQQEAAFPVVWPKTYIWVCTKAQKLLSSSAFT